ncbi:MAG TPA: ATP-binding protein [Nitrospirales bacterium]|nr:ATP-binding protein [Nitrospirales bacterium]
MSTVEPPITVAILGAGKGGTAMLESFLNLPHIRLLGIADTNPHALGFRLARLHNIPTVSHPLKLIQEDKVNLIIDVTGDPILPSYITEHKHSGAEVLGGTAAKVLLELIQHQTLIQTQLFQSEKLASLGTFASGIAHDINNPLYIILAMAEEIQEENQLERIRDHAASIHDAAQRIQAISRNITDYVHTPSYQELESIDLHARLEEALSISRFATKFREITVQKHYQNGLAIQGRSEEILQVFINLITNAIHAMEEKGSLTISTSHRNGTVQIAISDTGCGISPEHLPKIFNPFFSTKPKGQGTGLGLYNVKTIVKKYHGDLQVESELGKGTTFRLSFPAIPPVEGTVSGGQP